MISSFLQIKLFFNILKKIYIKMNDVKDCFSKLKDCCVQVEKHVNLHIMDKKLEVNQFTESYTALEKAKLYHYKEIVKTLMEIKTQINSVRFNFQKIEEFNKKQRLSEEERKHYSYVTQQIEKFDVPEVQEVVKRQSRRQRHNSDSNTSIESLHLWEDYLVKKEKSESMPNLSNLSNVPKRSNSSNRKNKKFVSSTFNDILEDPVNLRSKSFEVIEEDCNRSSGISDSSSINSYQTADDLDDSGEEIEEIDKDDLDTTTDEDTNSLSDYKKVEAKNYSLTNILESLNEFIEEEDHTKPIIVDVVLKNPSPTIEENSMFN